MFGLPQLDLYGLDGGGRVAFVDHVAATSTEAVVSASVVIPSTTKAGDIIIVYGFRRDTLTPPTGYAFIYEHKSTYTGLDQWTFSYYKIAVASDAGATHTFSVASSTRMGLGVVVLRSFRGYKIESTGYKDGAGTPTATPVSDKSVLLIASSNPVAATSTSYYVWGQRTALASTPAAVGGGLHRLCGSIAFLPAGVAFSGTVYSSSSSTDISTICVFIVPQY